MTRSRPRPSVFLHPALATILLAACGDGDGPLSKGPTLGGGSDPCTAALAAEPGVADLGPSLAALSSKRHGGLGTDVRDARDFVWRHRSRGRVEAAARSGSGPVAGVQDVGNIAVMEDDGTLFIPANAFDLEGTGLRFQPAGGGYSLRKTNADFRTPLGTRVKLADDETRPSDIGFSFPYFGASRQVAYVNSDGNVTFGAGDIETTARDLGRFLSGAPRIAPFFADLDPSSAGGVFVQTGRDAFTVTWCAVPAFESTDKVTAQATLLPDGAVELRFGRTVTLKDAIVGVSPGGGSGFAAADLTTTSFNGGAGQAVAERFSSAAEIDIVSAARKFYTSHPDSFDQLVFWTDQDVVGSETFAYESTIANSIDGIGQERLNYSAEFGSAGNLSSLVVMDVLSKYPSDPTARVANVGENTTLSLLGHESCHRWLALLQFKDGAGASDLLLGRQRAHWSFFFDSDGSFVEGNEIEDLGNGDFRTGKAVQRYGPLDLYAMGLYGPSEVPTLFFVESPKGISQDRESAPRSDVTFRGTRKDLTIDQIIAALGPRNPGVEASPKLHRQAFVYVVARGHQADAAATDKLERFRTAWEPYFQSATLGRMSLDTRLR